LMIHDIYITCRTCTQNFLSKYTYKDSHLYKHTGVSFVVVGNFPDLNVNGLFCCNHIKQKYIVGLNMY